MTLRTIMNTLPIYFSFPQLNAASNDVGRFDCVVGATSVDIGSLDEDARLNSAACGQVDTGPEVIAILNAYKSFFVQFFNCHFVRELDKLKSQSAHF